MHPKISIITPSFNQGRFIQETVKSVLSQNYPDFEHIIIDGGSTDGTLDILKKYSHLKIVSEPDSGQAAAVNKGLRMATGDIIGWLNSDDTYYPGVFDKVARTIDPEKGIFIIMGRCAYVDEHGKTTGKEHPSMFLSHERVVEIWKGYTIPQPAVFFHKQVYEKCGGLDESLYFCLDYDLFIRYSKLYHFHSINELFATYRYHASSKSVEILQGELLKKSMDVSRKYWGAPTTLSHWRYLLSYILYGGKIGIHSLNRLNMAEKSFYEKAWPAFSRDVFISFILFPPTLFRHVIMPRLSAYFRKGGG
jgi:glycosyltransferase involved in cell wall biosynthesis